ncbi:hypothetical protein E2C01_076780 [Portunus trituberculatus]|uniref:Uncharacterized protein n=1 Tax=Portunus trituberculatus TaxID=210409 RepID=A0A5B7IPK7_PORTR|nr:hypothetical protein [Portunus trituberculatus]
MVHWATLHGNTALGHINDKPQQRSIDHSNTTPQVTATATPDHSNTTLQHSNTKSQPQQHSKIRSQQH